MMLDTEVHADSAGCRTTGEWLRGAAESVHDAGTVLQRVRADSEQVWVGEAGEAFRRHVERGRKDADDLAWTLRRCGDALVAFADDLDTVLARMTQAREVAAEAGLTVTPTGVEPPGPLPGPATPVAPAGPLADDVAAVRSVADAVAHQRATEALRAWAEVQSTVGYAREVEQAAHDTLLRRIRDEQPVWESITTNWPFLLVDGMAGSLTGLQMASNRWRTAAGGLRGDAAAARLILDDLATAQPVRDQALRTFLSSSGQARAATRAAASNARLLGPLTRSATASRVLTIAGRSLRGVPVIGIGLTAAQIANDIAAGKPADRATAAGIAGLLSGTGATSGVVIAGTALGIAGGPLTLGAIAIGIGASVVASWVVDQYWDELQIVGDPDAHPLAEQEGQP